MNEQLVLVIIGLVVAAVILRPLVRGRRSENEPSPPPHLSPETSEQLAELELDRALGRVSDEDYARFRGELESSAPTASKEKVPVPGRGDSLQKAEALVRHWKQAPRPSCPACGIRPEPEAAFCSICGARLGA